MPPPSYQDELLEVIGHEIEADADALMDELRPEIAEVGAVEVPEAAYFDYIRKNWWVPGFREKLLDTIGPKNWWHDTTLAITGKVQPVTKELVGQVDHKPPAVSAKPPGAPLPKPRLAPAVQQPGAGLGPFNPGMM